MLSRKTNIILFLVLSGVIVYIIFNQMTISKVKNNSDALVISHRGANDRYPEHTLTAYNQAIKDKADYIEIDLRMTKDDYLVAMHDETVNRTTNGKGLVSEYTLEELKQLNLKGAKQNEKIPTLEEIFESFGQSTKYYIELRDLNDEPVMVEKLYELLKKYQLLSEEYIIIQSFSDRSLAKSKVLMPNIPQTKLYKSKYFDIDSAIKHEAMYIGIEEGDISKGYIKKLKQHGKKIHVYFLDKRTEKNNQRELIKEDVDGFFTDYNLYTLDLINRK